MLNQIDLSRIDLNLLTVFELVMQERHVGRAAVRLHLSPSAVSHSLGRLRRLLNDPLFIRHPRGLNPTERADKLAAPIAEILERARAVISGAERFDPARSDRQFVLAAVDGIGSVILPGLIARVRRIAPAVTIRIRAILPLDVVETLDQRQADVALAPRLELPSRFAARDLYQEDFVIAARANHPFLRRPTLKAYCAASHLVVTSGASASGFVDEILARRNLQRHIALTVPGFMWALTVLAETDLLGAVPRHLVTRHGRRAGVRATEPPIPLRTDPIAAITVKAGMSDAGTDWLLRQLVDAVGGQRADRAP